MTQPMTSRRYPTSKTLPLILSAALLCSCAHHDKHHRGHDPHSSATTESAVSTGGPLIVLYSEDLDETLAAVRGAGGRITKEPFDFPGGRRFQFLDPSGNELAVWANP